MTVTTATMTQWGKNTASLKIFLTSVWPQKACIIKYAAQKNGDGDLIHMDHQGAITRGG